MGIEHSIQRTEGDFGTDSKTRIYHQEEERQISKKRNFKYK